MNSVENDYRILGKLGEGTFAQVIRMKHKKSEKIFAMKRFKKKFKSIEEVECLREIQALKRLNPHPNIISLEDILFDPTTGTLYLAFELMDSNLYDVISKKGVRIYESTAALWFYQICKGLEYIHGKGIFHRDIKPENILISENVVKLADFGSCRGINSRQPLTEYIATRWYRSPEVLMGGQYTSKMDMFAAGCVFFEALTKNPLFPGSDAIDQLNRIHAILGTPSPDVLQRMIGSKLGGKLQFPAREGSGFVHLLPAYVGEDCKLVMRQLLEYDPEKRYSAEQALQLPFFKDIPNVVTQAQSMSLKKQSSFSLTKLNKFPLQLSNNNAANLPAAQPDNHTMSPLTYTNLLRNAELTVIPPKDIQPTIMPSLDIKQEGYLNRLNIRKHLHLHRQEGDINLATGRNNSDASGEFVQLEREKEKQIKELMEAKRKRDSLVGSHPNLKSSSTSNAHIKHLPFLTLAHNSSTNTKSIFGQVNLGLLVSNSIANAKTNTSLQYSSYVSSHQNVIKNNLSLPRTSTPISMVTLAEPSLAANLTGTQPLPHERDRELRDPKRTGQTRSLPRNAKETVHDGYKPVPPSRNPPDQSSGKRKIDVMLNLPRLSMKLGVVANGKKDNERDKERHKKGEGVVMPESTSEKEKEKEKEGKTYASLSLLRRNNVKKPDGAVNS